MLLTSDVRLLILLGGCCLSQVRIAPESDPDEILARELARGRPESAQSVMHEQVRHHMAIGRELG